MSESNVNAEIPQISQDEAVEPIKSPDTVDIQPSTSKSPSKTARRSTRKTSAQDHLKKQKRGQELSHIVQEMRKSGELKPRRSKQQRAGLIFPVNRVLKQLKEYSTHFRVMTNAGVYMTGVLEYLAAEILDVAGIVTISAKKHAIQPRHIMLAIEQDEVLHELLKDVEIRAAGISPFIHHQLLEQKEPSLPIEQTEAETPKKKQTLKKRRSRKQKPTETSAEQASIR